MGESPYHLRRCMIWRPRRTWLAGQQGQGEARCNGRSKSQREEAALGKEGLYSSCHACAAGRRQWKKWGRAGQFSPIIPTLTHAGVLGNDRVAALAPARKRTSPFSSTASGGAIRMSIALSSQRLDSTSSLVVVGSRRGHSQREGLSSASSQRPFMPRNLARLVPLATPVTDGAGAASPFQTAATAVSWR